MGTDNQNIQDGANTGTEKTFTQAEVDAVVKERLKRERDKYADYEDLKAKASKYDEFEQANKSELEKANERANALQAELDGLKKSAELKEMRTKIATENNVPVDLLTGTTEEECNTQVEAIKGLLSANGIPVTVSDGGEINHTGKMSTANQFANWAKERL